MWNRRPHRYRLQHRGKPTGLVSHELCFFTVSNISPLMRTGTTDTPSENQAVFLLFLPPWQKQTEDYIPLLRVRRSWIHSIWCDKRENICISLTKMASCPSPHACPRMNDMQTFSQKYGTYVDNQTVCKQENIPALDSHMHENKNYGNHIQKGHIKLCWGNTTSSPP